MKTMFRKFVAYLLAVTLGLSGGVWAGLETTTYINGLVATNPTSGDPVSQADDHMRLLKSALLATFPSITGAVTATHTQINSSAAGPAFAAYQGSLQSVPNATSTKVQFQTEEFDTAGAFDNATNYRFTPLVAGYYQVNWCVGFVASVTTHASALHKNSIRFKDGAVITTATVGCGSTLVQMNGSTDFLEVFVIQGSGVAANTSAAPNQTYFSASLIRGT